MPAGAWPNWVLGNHDKPRIASRVGVAQARVAAMLLLTLRGTPTLYYGDELGMTDVPIVAGAVRDPAELRQPGLGLGRDPERSPLPWDASPRAGFTTGEPWLPLGEHERTNVAVQIADDRSMLALHRRLLALRRTHRALTRGTLTAIQADGNVLSYERSDGEARLKIALNLGGVPQTVAVPQWARRLLLSTELDRASHEAVDGRYALRPNEGIVITT